jgi:hypothetical protein
VNEPREDDVVPVSVRLGQVVPPEDPEDWSRPLTWAAALGMLAAPAVALGWFWLAAPSDATRPAPGTWLLAAALVAGGVLTGATQLGGLRAFTGTLATGLFAALGTVLVAVLTAGERQVEAFSPTLAHAFAAAVVGMAGVVVAAPLAARFARAPRSARIVAPASVGIALTLVAVPLLFSA